VAHFSIWKDVVGDMPVDQQSTASLAEYARAGGPGVYLVQEKFHSDSAWHRSQVASSREWGKVVHEPDGRIELQPIEWGD
jgi:hypothetical protein